MSLRCPLCGGTLLFQDRLIKRKDYKLLVRRSQLDHSGLDSARVGDITAFRHDKMMKPTLWCLDCCRLFSFSCRNTVLGTYVELVPDSIKPTDYIHSDIEDLLELDPLLILDYARRGGWKSDAMKDQRLRHPTKEM